MSKNAFVFYIAELNVTFLSSDSHVMSIKGTLFTYIVYHVWCWIFARKALHVTHAIVICSTLTSLTRGWPS